MPQTVFPENQAQLDALSKLALLFSSHGIEFWLRGGWALDWALDFLLGRETRPHRDVDGWCGANTGRACARSLRIWTMCLLTVASGRRWISRART